DVLRDRFIDVPLTQLREAKAGSVSNQFMATAAADADEDEVPDSMLKDRAVTNLLDVVEVGSVASGPRAVVGEIAQAARYLGQMLPSDLRITLPDDAVVTEEAFQLLAVYSLPSQQVDGRRTDDTHVRRRIEVCGRIELVHGHPFP